MLLVRLRHLSLILLLTVVACFPPRFTLGLFIFLFFAHFIDIILIYGYYGTTSARARQSSSNVNHEVIE